MMRKLLWLPLLLLLSLSAFGQVSSQPRTLVLSTDPTGACADGFFAVNIIDITNWVCIGNTWHQVIGAGAGGVIDPSQLPTFVTGTGGVDFNIVVGIDNITFNMPD